ncbi:MAG: putative transport system permease protein [Actinomycetota bacterium]|nr:putative transport system permease protein [Actinomycetota bacterium]
MLKATLRNLFAHKIRLLLTGLSVVIGVGFLAGTLVFTDTLKATFNGLVGRVSKNLSVVVRAQSDFSSQDIGASSARAPVPASLIDKVKTVDGVQDAVGAVQGIDLLITQSGKAVTPKSPGPPTLAVSWTPSNFSTLTFVQGRGPSGAGEVAVDKSAADQYNLHIGDPVTVQTQGDPIQSKIVGIVTVGGSSNLAGAVLSVFDVPTAQQVVGKPGFVNQIDVRASSGVSQATLAARISPILPKGYEAITGAASNKEQSDSINKALGFFNVFLLIFAGVALFVGLFIILNTFTMLVAQRTRELALLRAIGASRRQVMNSVLGEASIVAVLASTLGLVGGLVVAIGLRGLLDAVGVSMPSGSLVIRSSTVIWSYVVGIVVTLVAALVPAYRAARIPPVAAMRDNVALPERTLRVRAIVGSVVTVLGALAIASSIRGNGGKAAATVGFGILIVIIGIWISSAFLARPVVRVLGAPLRRLFGTAGWLARSNAMRNPRRTAVTATTLMIGLAIVSLLSVLASSTKASIASVVDRNLGADYVLTSSSFTGFSPDVAKRAAAAPGVSTVVEQRFGPARVGGHTVQLLALTPNFGALLKLDAKAGTVSSLDESGLLLAQATATSRNLHVGDSQKVEFPNGSSQDLRVQGIYNDSASNLLQFGNGYLIALPTYAAHTGEQLDLSAFVLAKAGQRDQVADSLKAALQGYPQVKIQGQAAYKDAQQKQINTFLGLMYGLLGLSLLVAVLGIANTLALSVYERVREIGLLRAIGMARRQVRRMIRLESGIIAAFGALLGVVLGSVFGWAIVSSSGDQVNRLVFPVPLLVFFVVGAAVIGVLAAVFPAWRAARKPVLAAIATE